MTHTVDRERFIASASAAADAVVAGRLEPEGIPIPVGAESSSWLDSIEDELFKQAHRAASGEERLRVGYEWAGFRLLRLVAWDNPAQMSELINGGLWTTLAEQRDNPRLRQLLRLFTLAASAGKVH
jgi:hypothetical protein